MAFRAMMRLPWSSVPLGALTAGRLTSVWLGSSPSFFGLDRLHRRVRFRLRRSSRRRVTPLPEPWGFRRLATRSGWSSGSQAPSGFRLLRSSPPFQRRRHPCDRLSSGLVPYGSSGSRRLSEGCDAFATASQGLVTLSTPSIRPGPPGFVSPRSALGVHPFRAFASARSSGPLGPNMPSWRFRPSTNSSNAAPPRPRSPTEDATRRFAFRLRRAGALLGVQPLQGP